LTPRCLQVRVKVSNQTIVYIFYSVTILSRGYSVLLAGDKHSSLFRHNVIGKLKKSFVTLSQ
jgi:hypothetical protein